MKWSEYFIKLTDLVASKSKDRRAKVGAVIIDNDNAIVSTGYNGFPRGVNDKVLSRHEKPAKHQWAEHAERNAIYNAARRLLKGTTLAVNAPPCTECARAIIQSGIVCVIIQTRVVPMLRNERWREDFKVSLEMLNEAGVKVQYD